MFFAVVLADLVLPLFFMEMVISQNVDSAVNYLSILPFPCLIGKYSLNPVLLFLTLPILPLVLPKYSLLSVILSQ